MIESPQVQVPAAKGLNTWAARGSTDAPRVLRNAVLRPGGWGCAPAAQPQLTGVTAALYAGQRSDLFVQTATGLAAWDGEALTPLTGGAGQTLAGAVTLGPGLALLSGDRYAHASFGVRPSLTPMVIQEWDGVGTAPTTPYWRRAAADLADAYFRYAEAYTLWVVPIRDLDAPSPHNGVTVLNIPAIPQPATATNDSYSLVLGGIATPVDLYHDGHQRQQPRPPVRFVRNVTPTFLNGRPLSFDAVPLAGASPRPSILGGVRPRVAEYHQGRLWAAGAAGFFPTPVTAPTPTYVEASRTRLYYTEVIASFSEDALPLWVEDYYFDVPFKVSTEIVALQSAGRYLYVFGDREVLVLSGYDDASWTIESVGDSVGAISAASVQRLQNVALYLSDSGVLALSGGQVQDVSGDVRDLVLGLNRPALTSTVDFAQEQYLISDGATTLVYHLREQGWTVRDPDGAGQRLVYGGGVPYSVHGEALHSLDSPDLLPLTVTVGPFGRPGTRRTWRGVTGAVDSDVGGAARVTLSGLDTDLAFLPVTVPGAPQDRPAHAGLTPLAASVGDADGVALSAALVELTVTLTPAPGARRCILRPPLEIVGAGATEAWA